MKDFKNLDKVVYALEAYDQMNIVCFKEKDDNGCREYFSRYLSNKYNIPISSLLSAYTELWYQKGKEDALKELKDKL